MDTVWQGEVGGQGGVSRAGPGRDLTNGMKDPWPGGGGEGGGQWGCDGGYSSMRVLVCEHMCERERGGAEGVRV